MNSIAEKIIAYKNWYGDYRLKRPEISVSEIREAVTGKVDTLKDIIFLIRIQTGHGHNNGGVSKSSAMGAKHEYYGLKDNEIVEVPFFAPDNRYFSQTGIDGCGCLELSDIETLMVDVEKNNKRKINATNVFKRCFPKSAKKYDLKHGSDNWWAEGTAKTGFDVYFKP